jgi:hypothetical protein|tara:strand:- start:321 stop:518 length:198 start_codon:yes stop_codon:yes gene_type:complete
MRKKYLVWANVYGGCGEHYNKIVAKGFLPYCKERYYDCCDDPDEYRGIYIEEYKSVDGEPDLEDF